MLKKIKVSELINLDNLGETVRFFIPLNGAIQTVLEDTLLPIGDYELSYLYKLFDTDASQLDLDYFIGFSSEKYLSRYFIKYMEKYDLYHAIENIVDSVAHRFALKWYKIGEALTTNYKPLDNYDMEEIRTPNLREELTRKQNTDTNVHQETESAIYGFNSTNPNPTASGNGDTHTTGLKANNQTEDIKSNTGTERLTRHGNIGVTTSQQMLESEIKLRQFNFLEEIFKDIDSILCLKVY